MEQHDLVKQGMRAVLLLRHNSKLVPSWYALASHNFLSAELNSLLVVYNDCVGSVCVEGRVEVVVHKSGLRGGPGENKSGSPKNVELIS